MADKEEKRQGLLERGDGSIKASGHYGVVHFQTDYGGTVTETQTKVYAIFVYFRVKRVTSSEMPLLSYSIMPLNRKVLGPISGNIQKRRELNLYQRGKIIAATGLGRSNTEIANNYSYLESPTYEGDKVV